MARVRESDRELWREATRNIKPLSGRKSVAPAAPKSPPKEKPLPAASPAPRAPKSVQVPTGPTPKLDRRSAKRVQSGAAPIEARLDLHGMTQDRAHRALTNFIRNAAEDDVRLALVITGKGRQGQGVLRDAVPRWLAEAGLRARILAVSPANVRHGGDGALYVQLRRRDRTKSGAR